MKNLLYTNLQRKIIAITLLVSFAPLILLGITMYYHFAGTSKHHIELQIKYRAEAQAEAVDLFLREHTAILGAMADILSFEEIIDKTKLSRIFEVMNTRAGAFVDLGVIDANGHHQTYVGPYDLAGLNYYDQPWFAEVMSRGIYISDVFLGFRKLPHFIIAVRRQESNNRWILRATIDPNILGQIVGSAQIGKTGDAYLINDSGVYQTTPRFQDSILSQSNVDTRLFGGRVTAIENTGGNGKTYLYAGSRLKNKNWLLIINQDSTEQLSDILEMRNTEIVIIMFGVLAIILTTVLTTRFVVNQLRHTDTRMNELNAQLVQSDKLAALGKMAAGVAHEINNPLAVILQKTGWMEDLLADEEFRNSGNIDEFKTSISKIEEHVERARKVVHNMLGYARRMEPRLEDVDINATLNQTITLLENYARLNDIDIQTDLSDNLPVIASDQAKLQQVFMNLISNAIDAIGKEGAVEIISRHDDGRVYVAITDDGPGIPEEIQRSIFDPFYSTKDTGKGTGLGLWVCHNIIEQMGGHIGLESKIGKGAIFTVDLPIIIPGKK